MNVEGTPQGGFDGPREVRPPSPVAVQQTTVIQVGGQKSVVGAVVLAFFFGPLGMLYVTVPGALIMFVISFMVAIATLGLGLLITLPACAIWAGVAASSHNRQLHGVTSHQAIAGRAAAPAGWHNDPEGSGRLRYYDGMRWTTHYAGQTVPPAPAQPPAESGPPAEIAVTAEGPGGSPDEEADAVEKSEADEEVELEASEAETRVVKAEPQQVFCGACGHSIAAGARFCSACGATQAID